MATAALKAAAARIGCPTKGSRVEVDGRIRFKLVVADKRHHVGDSPIRSLHARVGMGGEQVTVPGYVNKVVVHFDGRLEDPGLLRDVVGVGRETEYPGCFGIQGY